MVIPAKYHLQMDPLPLIQLMMKVSLVLAHDDSLLYSGYPLVLCSRSKNLEKPKSFITQGLC